MKDSKVKCIIGCIRAHWKKYDESIGDYITEMHYARALERKLAASIVTNKKHNNRQGNK